MPVTSRVDGNVAVVTIDHPPVNGLGHAVRTAFLRELRQALASEAIRAVVVTGRKGCFSAGADITEFGTPRSTAAPTLAAIIGEIDASTKPIVAAVDGTCFGGGLELALATHYRIATPSSTLALPEVKLGFVPGSGGTQRLPRAIGMAAATDLITTGKSTAAEELANIPGQRLFEGVYEGDIVVYAVQVATRIADARPLPRLRDLTPDDRIGDNQLTEMRATLRAKHRGLEAPIAALDLIARSATTPFDEAIAEERATFLRLVGGTQSAGLRHVFFAERQARKIPDLPADTITRPIEAVVVIGAGTMGCGIAVNFLDAGLPVTLIDTTRDALERGRRTIAAIFDSRVHKGALSSSEKETRLLRLRTSIDLHDGANADLVVEAVFESWDVKRSVFSRLDAVMKPGAILATNTSTLDVDELADVTERPQDVVGLHFFSPAHVMKLLEVVRGARTAPDVLATAMTTARRLGKTAVVSGVCDGFIGNRMLQSYRDAAGRLLRSGLSPQDIDNAIESFGFAMGPYRVSDLAGNDVGWAVRKRRYAEKPDIPHDTISDTLCEMGRFGQKTGAGWYDYPNGGRNPVPSPVVEEMLSRFRPGIAAEERPSDRQIAERLVFALVDEGARILDEGIAQRASDIDVVYVSGYGFPRHLGGPMYYADQVGLDRVLAELIADNPDGWQPAPLLIRLAKEGGTFG
ncbi:3-hydroxyacyl-CoA dehydrogenase NAD-binding domain-containing protein [Rhodococcus sp. NPDC057014]|uniref:3-hydroxyacyl-CoA dehydrogenase NAD-binding domain-containing protein n=1 Tax=Rhodococcus sp. NPDC057014 TaxID=3346000 RepID=UPI00363CEACC